MPVVIRLGLFAGLFKDLFSRWCLLCVWFTSCCFACVMVFAGCFVDLSLFAALYEFGVDVWICFGDALFWVCFRGLCCFDVLIVANVLFTGVLVMLLLLLLLFGFLYCLMC